MTATTASMIQSSSVGFESVGECLGWVSASAPERAWPSKTGCSHKMPFITGKESTRLQGTLKSQSSFRSQNEQDSCQSVGRL